MVNILLIDRKWLEENINEKANQSIYDSISGYLSQSVGALRGMQITQKAARLANEANKDLGLGSSRTLTGLDSNLGVGVSALNIPRLPSVTMEAVKSISALRADDGVNFFRKCVKAVRDFMDAVAAYGFVSIFITGNPALKTVAQAADLTTDIADLHISASDYSKASELEARATGDAKEALTHTRKYNLIRVAKATSSIAMAILGIVLVATGILFPMTALAILLVTSTAIAIFRDLHRDWGRFNVIKFDQEVTLAV
jgi:hypothetical protein